MRTRRNRVFDLNQSCELDLPGRLNPGPVAAEESSTSRDKAAGACAEPACSIHALARCALGPTTRGIAASLKLCFDEQLDWTHDDDVRKWLWVRRLLDGDFPPDPADFHFLSDYDPNDLTLDMMRQKVFLERLNIL